MLYACASVAGVVPSGAGVVSVPSVATTTSSATGVVVVSSIGLLLISKTLTVSPKSVLSK